MVWQVLTLAVCGLAVGFRSAEAPCLDGVVVNGTLGGTPVAGAEVVLRAGEPGALLPVAQTVTDPNGRFVFDNLPSEPGLIYLPGANRHGVHYPGPQVRLPGGAAPTWVKLTVYDAGPGPSPLIADRHEIDVHVQPGVLAITETLVVNNPTLTTYLGEGGGEAASETLALAIPKGFERVTFHSEFHGRHFQLANQRVTTNLPWPPGKRELHFTYHLPVEDSRQALERALDLPCARVRVRIRGEQAERVECNLPRAASPDGSGLVFASVGETLAAGHKITLRSGGWSAPWIVYARWAALGVLGGLVLLTVGLRTVRRPLPQRRPAPDGWPKGSQGTHRRRRRRAERRTA
jgi:hypothetical protein